MKSAFRDDRPRQVLAGLAVMAGLGGLVWIVILGTRLPGFAGEFFRLVVGICTTPVFLESTFLILGLVLVMFLNHWRQRRDGDELVHLDQVTGPEVPADLPDHARFAVYATPPADPVEPSALERAEGFLEIGDPAAAAAALAELDADALQAPDALRVRARLAAVTGRHQLAAELTRRLGA